MYNDSPRSRKLVLITGVPGSGKTTLIKNILKTREGIYLQVDDIKDGLFGDKDRDSQDYLIFKPSVHKITNNIIKTNIEIGHTVFVENTFHDEVIYLDWWKRFNNIIESKNIFIIRCIVSSSKALFDRLKLRNLKRDQSKIYNSSSFCQFLDKENVLVDMNKGIVVDTENMKKAVSKSISYIDQ